MLTKLQVLEWEIEFDKGITAQAYTGLSVSCECAYCRNFLIVCQNLPVEYTQLLAQLGIDPMKPANIVEYNEHPDGTHLYGWWYHVTGKITKDSNALVMLNSEIEITITNKDYLIAKSFPRPVIQIEFFSSLPWALAEKL
jgi:hypothetical protein